MIWRYRKKLSFFDLTLGFSCVKLMYARLGLISFAQILLISLILLSLQSSFFYSNIFFTQIQSEYWKLTTPYLPKYGKN